MTDAELLAIQENIDAGLCDLDYRDLWRTARTLFAEVNRLRAHVCHVCDARKEIDEEAKP